MYTLFIDKTHKLTHFENLLSSFATTDAHDSYNHVPAKDLTTFPILYVKSHHLWLVLASHEICFTHVWEVGYGPIEYVFALKEIPKGVIRASVQRTENSPAWWDTLIVDGYGERDPDQSKSYWSHYRCFLFGQVEKYYIEKGPRCIFGGAFVSKRTTCNSISNRNPSEVLYHNRSMKRFLYINLSIGTKFSFDIEGTEG